MVSLESSETHSSITWFVTGVLVIWFGIIFVLGASGAFVRSPGELPLLILFGVAIPLIVFFVAFSTSKDFRDFARSVDLPRVNAIQA